VAAIGLGLGDTVQQKKFHGEILHCPDSCRSLCNEKLVVSYNVFVMIAKDLLEILVCPVCRKPLEHRVNPESLKCTECHRVYPVKDEIPIMLVDQAKIEAP
jgi:uncharacterized protein